MSNRNVSVRQQLYAPYTRDRADIVIIGNGIAGLTAAVEARRLAPNASIVMITDQTHPTIHTPALKQFAIGKVTQEQLLAYPAGTERTRRIHVMNAHIDAIHAQEQFVYLHGGYGFGYGSLLIATGSRPNGLPASLPGRNFDGVCTLHRLDDYLDLRRRLPEVSDAVVIGGGAHAVETVMSLLHVGISIHWLIRGETLLSRMLDTPASEMVLERIRRAGAKVYTNTQVTGIVGRIGSVAGVVINEDEMIPCQLVLTCTGTSPITTLAEHCTVPIVHRNGILVDSQLRTNVRNIYAAGDVAAIKNPLTGGYEPRPVWYAAVLQGRTAAAMMTGHPELAKQPSGVSWHATHLGELCMLSVGNIFNESERAETLTNSSKRSYRRMSFIGDRLVGYLSLGPTQPDSLAIKRIIDEGLSIRDIKKALLKGNFDARKYFSRQQSHAARDMVTSGRIPSVHVPPVPYIPLPSIPQQSQRFTEPLSAKLPSVHEDDGRRTTDPLRATRPLPDLADLTMPDEGVHVPDTNPVSKSVRKSSVYNHPTIHMVDKEGNPIMDDLAALLAKPVSEKKCGIEAMLLPLPSHAAPRTLWSYSSKVPAVKIHHSSPAKSVLPEKIKSQFIMVGK